MAQQRVGFIGLGTMGFPMSSNILKRGFPLTVYDVVPTAVERSVALGAQRADSPRALAARSDVIVTSLPNSPDVEAVYLGDQGVLAGAQPATILVEMSTIDPLVSRRLAAAAAERGVRMLDAPVAKTSAAAVTGTLTIMVGGDRDAMQEALPVLQAMGTDIFYCGSTGSGHAMKLVNNLISTNLMVLNSEALVLGAKCGLTVETMLEVMGSTAASNGQLVGTMRNRVLGGDEQPGFMVRLAYKDLGLILQLGNQLGISLPLTALCREAYSEAQAAGLGSNDLSTVLKVKERQAGVQVRLADAGGITDTSPGTPR
jgi:4-hydroxybutyrate dehydrogenase/sulfolactaldehyde 3-reductase